MTALDKTKKSNNLKDSSSQDDNDDDDEKFDMDNYRELLYKLYPSKYLENRLNKNIRKNTKNLVKESYDIAAKKNAISRIKEYIKNKNNDKKDKEQNNISPDKTSIEN